MHTEMPISQWSVLRKDKWLLSCITWIPILLAMSTWWIFSANVATNINFGVVDLENSTLSRELIRNIDSTATLKVSGGYQSAIEAKNALINGDIYGYAIIPTHYSRDIYLNNPPQITVFYNSQYILVGRLINAAIAQAHGTFDAKLGIVKQLAKGNNSLASAAGRTVTIQNQITPLFNRNTNYAQFLVSAIVPALWQIIIIVATILALAANHRVYGLKRMLGDKPLRQILTICGFYIPFFALLGFGFLSWFYVGFEWPMIGSLVPILYAQLLTIFACIIMGAFFFFLTLDPARAMSFAGAFTAPSFAFMGVTFPATDMSIIASTWRSLLPISHYIEAQISQVSYGVTSFETISAISTSMAGYLLPLILIYPLCKKHLGQLEKNS
ncbi:ABC transporter permease [Vibrio algarum]|uniref:ABC transporter permease n=1 Tax=Vibrio algarum TaxID=3020714 RepID=A0ABT4YQI2_9VIBR|nr:ABC transporter permease [Vibrio sp. KJ40-1]MDB1123815.1 ABC transporter permease [Vibrio sp. KJ40-1]